MPDLTVMSSWTQDAHGGVTITGKTTPNATVKITVDNNTHSTTANAEGNYSITIPISQGDHDILAETGEKITERQRVTILPNQNM